jgi:hypothetical protein
MLILYLITNIIGVAQKLELDVVIHLALEFAIRRHRTVEVWAMPHPLPRVPGLRLWVPVLI